MAYLGFRNPLSGLLIVVLFAWLVSPASPASADQAENIKDFGVSDIQVRSVQTLAVADCNARLQQAAANREAWTREAILVALHFVGPELRGHTKVIEVKTPPERRDSATVTVTESGYPDDAVAGARWRLWLARDATGGWLINRALWAQLCARPGQTFYSATPCP